jgi:hypothetical protein
MTDYLEMRVDGFDFNTAKHQPKLFDNQRQSAPISTKTHATNSGPI